MKYETRQIAIGGIGGSGTRAVAELFEKMGYFIGYDLNRAKDNLLYTLLFKRKDILVLPKNELKKRLNFFYKYSSTSYKISENEKKWLFKLAEKNNIKHSKEWLMQRVEVCINTICQSHNNWGWKEPNTHVIIDKILELSLDIKFIYVYRNGLDMAFSSNQNQLEFWGNIFLNEHTLEINAKNSLKYWCEVHERMLRLQKNYPENIYMLNLDTMCIDTNEELKKLFYFLKKKDMKDILKYEKIFVQSNSIGRYKNFGLEQFDIKDLNYLKTIYSDIE